MSFATKHQQDQSRADQESNLAQGQSLIDHIPNNARNVQSKGGEDSKVERRKKYLRQIRFNEGAEAEYMHRFLCACG